MATCAKTRVSSCFSLLGKFIIGSFKCNRVIILSILSYTLAETVVYNVYVCLSHYIQVRYKLYLMQHSDWLFIRDSSSH